MWSLRVYIANAIASSLHLRFPQISSHTNRCFICIGNSKGISSRCGLPLHLCSWCDCTLGRSLRALGVNLMLDVHRQQSRLIDCVVVLSMRCDSRSGRYPVAQLENRNAARDYPLASVPPIRFDLFLAAIPRRGGTKRFPSAPPLQNIN